MMTTSFAFATCQRGAEHALEAEVRRLWPTLRPAYRRPGLSTFKVGPDAVTAGLGERALAPVFGRAWGWSLGLARSAAEARALADGVPGGVGAVHVFERDRWRPGEHPPAHRPGARAAVVEAELAGLGGAGQAVLDVVVPLDDDPWLVGWHRRGPAHAPFPGGIVPLQVPADAPSWSFRKVEEAIALAGFEPRHGEVALELGAAPGGASYALVRRGLHVVAVDPQPMHRTVAEEAARRGLPFRHIKLPMAAVTLEELPPRVEWLLMDVHLAPPVALHGLARYLARYKQGLRGAILTLKLNTWELASAIPEWLERLRGLGLVEPHARQLPSNRQEICVTARGRD
ncbi:MAG: hypothetical protein IT385_31055 [Deltaproteobacteria bacterium]|nr:hypothetical protein [Deltaproteobacteria bacterium]